VRPFRQLLPVAALLVAACGGSPTTPPAGSDGLRDAPPSTLRTVADPVLTVRVLRVLAPTGGGGDALLVADSAGARPWYALIDAGDGSAAAYLAQAGIDTVDVMVLTHAHEDHYGGMDAVFAAAHVRRFITNGQVRSLASYEEVMARARAEADTVVVSATPWIGSMPGGGRVIVMPPLDTWIHQDTDDGSELNNGSLAVRFEEGGFSLLDTGDAELQANQRFAATYPTWVKAVALKVGHHGSTDATQAAWLAAVTPQLEIVSANGTTHPHGAALALLEAQTPDLFCTPDHGIVSVFVNGTGSWAVHTAKDPRQPCSVGSDAY